MRCLLILLLLMPALCCAAPAPADDARARELINSQGCKGCHRIEGSGGTLGPDLSGVGKRLSRQALRQQLVAPQKRHPQGRMPAYAHLDAAELDALVAFLARL